jgi:hypothetical protein
MWIATHDLAFMSAHSAIARFAVSRSDGNTRVAPVESAAGGRDAIANIGWLPSDALIADTLICCEGPSDRRVFEARVRMKRSAKYAGVVIADLGGVGKVWGRNRADVLRLARVARSAVAHGRVVAMIDRDKHDQNEVDVLTQALRECSVGVYSLARAELEDYWLISRPLVHAILGSLAEEATIKRGEPVHPPSLSDIEAFLDNEAREPQASKRLAELCDTFSLRWSKDDAARIAIALVDSLAPEVAEAIDSDLEAALDAAEPTQ